MAVFRPEAGDRTDTQTRLTGNEIHARIIPFPPYGGGLPGVREDPIMLKKIVPVLVLAAFVAGPVAAPAFAAGDKAAAACEKIKDKAKKAECLKKAKMKK
jgi:hypothetical protein